MFDINGSTLSYILNRYTIKLSDLSSESRILLYVIPQGSVISQLLFSIYIPPIRYIIS